MNRTLRNLCLFLLIFACLAAIVLTVMLGSAMYKHFFTVPDYRGGVVSATLPVGGEYLFFSGAENYKFDIASKRIYPICNSNECDDDCPFKKRNYSVTISNYTTITAAEDGRVYFHYLDKQNDINGIYTYAYADTKTGNITVLATLSKKESQNTYIYSKNFLYGDYLYCVHKKLIDGGNENNHSDYVNAVFRIPKDGGDEEFLFECGNEELYMVEHGKVITSSQYASIYLYSYDIETGEKETIYSAANIITNLTYYKGKLYFLAQENINSSDYRIISLHLDSKKSQVIVDSPASYFCIAQNGEGIYYLGNDRSTIRYCTLAGADDTELYSGKNYFYSFTVIENKMYGKINIYDEKTDSYIANKLIIFDPVKHTYESFSYPTFHISSEE